MDFFEQVNDKNYSLITDFSIKSDILIICFGGIKGGLGIPVFEFAAILKDIPCKKIFIRDITQSWYHKGLSAEGNINNITELSIYLKEQIKICCAKKIIMVGNSAGGYAAILFGKLLNVDIVHAFAPQTFINKLNRIRYFDFRWYKAIRKITKYPGIQKEYLDLRSVLPNKLPISNKTTINVYYDKTNRLDFLHCRRINGYPGIKLNEYYEGGHKVVKTLKDKGILAQILIDSLTDK